MQRAPVAPGRNLSVGAAGLLQSAVAGHGDDRVVAGAFRLQAVEKRLGELHGGDLTTADHLAELPDAGEDHTASRRRAHFGASDAAYIIVSPPVRLAYTPPGTSAPDILM